MENNEYFNAAFAVVKGLEGGYSNKQTDRGRETLFGISRVKNPQWKGWKVVDHIKNTNPENYVKELNNSEILFNMAKDFYRDNYFNVSILRLNKIDNKEIVIELFDTSVNMGVGTAGKMLQEALNLMNRNERLFKDLTVDGLIGAKTLACYAKVRKKVLLKVLNGLQFCRYKKIVENDQTQEINFVGWMKRISL